MSLKQKLEQLRNELSKNQTKRDIDLDVKINNFINWYLKNMVKGHCDDIRKSQKSNNMRKFIEKMAVWYELRYPDYKINKLMSMSSQEAIEINDNIKVLGWDEFVFIANERAYLSNPEYPKYYNLKNVDVRLELTSTGIIQNSEELNSLKLRLSDDERRTIDKEFKGKHIEELVKFLKERATNSDVYKDLEEIITNYNNQLYQKEEMLNCVMYRIIERGGNRIGPRRALLFAKEFGRNIDIPMMYGIDYSDQGLRKFIIEYIKAGGSKDLICYIGYFSMRQSQKIDTVTIDELLKTLSNDDITKYTPEEIELHQRMVNALTVRKEEIKQLNLNKSKNINKK